MGSPKSLKMQEIEANKGGYAPLFDAQAHDIRALTLTQCAKMPC
jgi:hypothetical protein